MSTSQFFRNLRNYSVEYAFLALCVLEIIALFRAPGWYSNTTILNTLAFIGVSYLTVSQLFGQKHSFLWAILWSVLVTGPLGWVFGLIAVCLYWYLFSKKKRVTSKPQPHPQSQSQSQSQTSGILKRNGVIPLLRIPIPWMSYALDLDRDVLTQRNIFRKKKKGSSSHKEHLLGSEDPIPLSNIYDLKMLDAPFRKLFGSTWVDIWATKYGPKGDTEICLWCVHPEIAETTSNRWIELKQKK